MKKLKLTKELLIGLVFTVLFFSCSSDDDAFTDLAPDPDSPISAEASVILNEVEYLGDRVEILNNGTETVDLTGFFLCLGPGTYRQIGTLEAEGNLVLAAGEFLVVSYEMPNETGGLGLFSNNDGFGDPSNIVDFVQWGAAGSPREDVAATAGIWTIGDFINVIGNTGTSIAFDGEGNSASDWTETATPTFGAANAVVTPETSVVLNEIAYLGDEVELYNNGNVAVDVSDYFLCLGPSTYRQIGALPADGDFIIQPGDFLVVTYDQLNVDAAQINSVSGTGGLGLYINNSGFANPDTLSDFVQWGAAGSFRENVAVAAGIWTENEFVEVVGSTSTSIAFDGEGDTAADWAETATPTFGNANSVVAPDVSIVLNEITYLGDQVELFNNGNVTIDVSTYFLCLGPGTYRQVGGLPTEGDLGLEPGAFLVITYDQINTAAGQIENENATGGLGLYINNSGFANPDTLADFVQWGAAGSFRENVAVAAGIWTENEFVEIAGIANTSIAFDGEGNSASDWTETTTLTFGEENVITALEASIVLNEVAFLGNQVELYNNGDLPVDVSNYFLCLGPGTYRQVGSLPSTGNVMIQPGEFLVVTYDQINGAAGQINGVSGTGGLGLYINNSGFANPDTLSDFVQWGAAGSFRENVAVTAGLWTTGDFVVVSGSTTNSIAFDGEGNTSEDWNEGSSTFGGSN